MKPNTSVLDEVASILLTPTDNGPIIATVTRLDPHEETAIITLGQTQVSSFIKQYVPALTTPRLSQLRREREQGGKEVREDPPPTKEDLARTVPSWTEAPPTNSPADPTPSSTRNTPPQPAPRPPGDAFGPPPPPPPRRASTFTPPRGAWGDALVSGDEEEEAL